MKRDDAIRKAAAALDLSTTPGPEGEAALRAAHRLMAENQISDRDIREYRADEQDTIFGNGRDSIDRTRLPGESDEDFVDRVEADYMKRDGTNLFLRGGNDDLDLTVKRVRARRRREAEKAKPVEQREAEKRERRLAAQAETLDRACREISSLLRRLNDVSDDEWTVARLAAEYRKWSSR